MTKSSNNKIAVVILNYNSSEDCRRCVDDLLKQQGVQLEIVVVDNCSRPQEWASVEALCREHGLTFIPLDENRGYNAGNNVGLRYAAEKGYEYALIVNPDMRFSDERYVEKLVAEFKEDSDIVAVGSDIIGPDGRHQNPMAADNGNMIDSFGWIKDLVLRKKGNADTLGDWIDRPYESHYCAKLSGCCLMLKVDFLNSIDFFDENVFLYCEEAILARQIEIAGKRAFYTTSCRAEHHHIEKTKGDPRPRFRAWRKSRCYYQRKYAKGSTFARYVGCLSITLYTSLLILKANLTR